MFDLQRLNPSKRFYWEDKDENDLEIPEEEREYVDFRIVPDGEMRSIRKKLGVKKPVLNTKLGKMELLPDIDNEELLMKFYDALFCYQVENWCLLQKDGTKIDCVDENKLLLYHKCPEFTRWADKCINDLAKENKLIEEEEEKN